MPHAGTAECDPDGRSRGLRPMGGGVKALGAQGVSPGERSQKQGGFISWWARTSRLWRRAEGPLSAHKSSPFPQPGQMLSPWDPVTPGRALLVPEETPWPREGPQMGAQVSFLRLEGFPGLERAVGTSPFSDGAVGRGTCLSPQTWGFSRFQDPCLPPASPSALGPGRKEDNWSGGGELVSLLLGHKSIWQSPRNRRNS